MKENIQRKKNTKPALRPNNSEPKTYSKFGSKYNFINKKSDIATIAEIHTVNQSLTLRFVNTPNINNPNNGP